MRITNNNGLPPAMFEALSKSEYSRGDADISVTELIDSPRIRQLKIKHADEIELEADSLLASFLGTAFHKAVETKTLTGETEKRYFAKVGGWTISGAVDNYDPNTGTVCDYKTANVFKVSLSDGGKIDEYEKQLNCYAYLLREAGRDVRELKIFILFKDWNARGYSSALKSGKIFDPWKKAGYPEKHWAYFNVPLWSPAVAKEYIEGRVIVHQEAEKRLPLCTASEIWRGSRCLKYCSVAPWCDQFKNQSQTGLMEE